MRRGRGLGVVGVIATMALPAIALASSLEKPAPGAWVPYATQDFVQSSVALGNFTVAGTAVKSMTFAVTSDSGENPGCPTGSLSVPGPVGLKRYKFAGGRPFWAFGRVVHKSFEAAPVTATLDGQPIKGAKLSLQFVAADTQGIHGDSSGGEFDFSAKCQVTLSEDISQTQNAGDS